MHDHRKKLVDAPLTPCPVLLQTADSHLQGMKSRLDEVSTNMIDPIAQSRSIEGSPAA